VFSSAVRANGDSNEVGTHEITCHWTHRYSKQYAEGVGQGIRRDHEETALQRLQLNPLTPQLSQSVSTPSKNRVTMPLAFTLQRRLAATALLGLHRYALPVQLPPTTGEHQRSPA
jgi:hypothetical protein